MTQIDNRLMEDLGAIAIVTMERLYVYPGVTTHDADLAIARLQKLRQKLGEGKLFVVDQPKLLIK